VTSGEPGRASKCVVVQDDHEVIAPLYDSLKSLDKTLGNRNVYSLSRTPILTVFPHTSFAHRTRRERASCTVKNPFRHSFASRESRLVDRRRPGTVVDECARLTRRACATSTYFVVTQPHERSRAMTSSSSSSFDSPSRVDDVALIDRTRRPSASRRALRFTSSFVACAALAFVARAVVESRATRERVARPFAQSFATSTNGNFTSSTSKRAIEDGGKEIERALRALAAPFASAEALVREATRARDDVARALALGGEFASNARETMMNTTRAVVHAHAEVGDVVRDIERYAWAIARQFAAWNVDGVDVVVTGEEAAAREIVEKAARVMVMFDMREVKYESERRAMVMVRDAYAAAQLAPHVGTLLAGISREDSMFITPDYTTREVAVGRAENFGAFKTMTTTSATMAVALTAAARWRMWNPYVADEDFITPLEASRSKAGSGECDELWGWSCLRDRYVLTNIASAVNGGTKVTFTALRSQRHGTAMGSVTMEATYIQVPVKRAALDVSLVPDAPSGNPWHRLTAIYGAFLTKSKFFPNRTDVDVLFGCPSVNAALNAPPGWEKIGTPKCKITALAPGSAPYDVIASSPKDGHLWDLAWDYTLPCKDEALFKAFVEQVTPNAFLAPAVPFKKRPACWIARESGRVRSVGNENDVIEAIKAASGPSGFEYLRITAQTTLLDTIAAVQKCGILVGLHGAGLINQIYALVDTTVIEIVPPGVAYYKNIAQLRDQKYIPVFFQGDTSSANVVVPTDTLKAALRDAYAARRKLRLAF